MPKETAIMTATDVMAIGHMPDVSAYRQMMWGTRRPIRSDEAIEIAANLP